MAEVEAAEEQAVVEAAAARSSSAQLRPGGVPALGLVCVGVQTRASLARRSGE